MVCYNVCMKLEDLNGIGKARKQSFEENGIFSCDDLINYLPYKYYDFSKTSNYADDGVVKLIKATITEPAKIVKIRGNFSFVTARMIDEFGNKFNAVWFNQTYMKSVLKENEVIYLYGKSSPTKKNTFIVNLSKFESKLKTNGFLPVYHTLSGVGQKVLHDAINQTLELQEISGIVPNDLLLKYNLISLKKAYELAHNPNTEDDIVLSKERIDLENIISLVAVNEYHKNMFREIKKQKYSNTMQIIDEFKKLLPFHLTQSQTGAIFEIEKDMFSRLTMNRLLQGDVGSGKTLVALCACFIAIKNGYQATIVAPTEILAKQHFETALKLFNNNINIELLSGSITGIEKRIALKNIKTGKSQLVIGTHAVISKNTEFNNLSMIVIDEQHKFGVEQRANLKQKGITPDVLVMSATPIPRSLSLILYGDLDLTQLTDRPKPAKIQTNIVSAEKQDAMWEYLNKQVENGSKVYVVCSKIDEDNDDECVKRFSAKNMFELAKTKFNAELVGLIHGKLKKESQNEVINHFRQGKIKVLVSTTIVEVGVDVPDSDIIVIATPERFGLATLHQLRGRVGRQGQESYCFCLANNLNQKSLERLVYFKNNSNGFDIAEFDLKTRGSGSVIGTNQHGNDNGMMYAFSSSNYALAKEILEQIKPNTELHTKIIEKGECLKTHQLLKKVVLN